MTSLRLLWRRARHMARMLVGLPDYANYVAHQHAKHPECVPMTETQFFRACQQSRYGQGQGRCC